ncbi:nucleotidyltransferase [Companilactobacillus sp. DQM5]|uniref:nucleotidyltransferase n=1 Tax=Companilactobacillus sp. DQM5 TaxID=3463359 RepID=UPI00405A054F
MKICGIIAEFNPLHNGHKYLIDQVKKQLKPDFLIVVMSGNFVQRGEFASFDKWDRAKMALEIGVDLIVELPFQFAVSSADIFAKGAVTLLNDLGCTHLVFGTEDVNFEYEQAAKKIISNKKENNEFSNFNSSYATQINNFYKKLDISVNFPNQMLGLNYTIQILKNDFPITIVPIKRISVDHDSRKTNGIYASASEIRKKIEKNKNISEYTPVKLPPNIKINYFQLLKYKIITSSIHELNSIYQMNEGIENKLKKEILYVNSIEEFLEKIKSSRFTYARLRRLLIYTTLNVKKMDIDNSHNFIHILGFNKKGQKLLSQIKDCTKIPIVTKVSKKIGSEDNIMGLQIKVDSVYSLFSNTDQNFKRKPEMEL